MKTRFFLFLCFLSLALAGVARAQFQVASHQKIAHFEGSFTGLLDATDYFGSSMASLGDLDGDGVPDLAVGARGDEDNGPFRGAVYILFLNADGTVRSHQKISDTEGGFTGVLDDHDELGSSVASLGDLDGDGVPDLAVGARGDEDNGPGRGAVYILFLNADGTVRSHQKISDTEGGFTGVLDDYAYFGWSLASVGDLDGDGTLEIAVGASGSHKGAAYILFLNADGTVRSHQKISDTEGGFTGSLDVFDYFGSSMASLGDLDGDGVPDLAVGAKNDDDGGTMYSGEDYGATYILFLNADGKVKSHQKISDTEGGFTGVLDPYDEFGSSVASVGDLDGDGILDIAVGASGDNDGGLSHGAAYILFLNADGTVKSHQKTSDTEGGFTGTLDDEDQFGSSVASIGDLDGDGTLEIAVGASGDDGSFTDSGAVWFLSMGFPPVEASTTPATVASEDPFTIEITLGSDDLAINDFFGIGFQLHYNLNEIRILSATAGPLLDTGNPNDLILFEDDDFNHGIASVGITRTKGHPGVDGHGVVLSFEAEIVPGFTKGVSEFTVKGLLAVNAAGETLHLDPATGSIEVVGALVWPGDTDNNGTVDIDDVLPVGIHFNVNGPTRKDADFSWTGQPSDAWTPEEATHADATGDGVVNQNDVLPIGLNYGETVPGGAAHADGGTAAKGAGSLAEITIPVTPVGERVTLELATDTPQVDLLGLAFEFGLDPALFRIHDALPGAFLDDGDVLSFDRFDTGAGVYAAAFTRKGSNPAATGTGALATITLDVIAEMTAPSLVTLGRATLSYRGGTLDRAPAMAMALLDATATANEAATGLPDRFELTGAYPNPFNPATMVAFDLPSSAEVTMVVYDVMGRAVSQVDAGRMAAGTGRTIRFEAGGLASGTYLYRVLARTADGVEAQTGRFVLMK